MPARLLPLAVALLAGCDGRTVVNGGGPTVTGSGVAATESRPLAGPCAAVRFGGVGTLTVTRGDTPALAVTWDDNLVGSVVTEVRDGVLEVSLKTGSYSSKQKLAVAVTLPKLTAATAGGQTTITADVGTVPAFAADASGQSRITLTGSAAAQTLKASGQSAVDAGKLGGATAAVDASGQSRVVAAVSDRVTGSASGQSTVEAAAAAMDVATSGQSAVRKR